MSALSHPSPNYDDRLGAAVTHIILHYTGMQSAAAALARLCDPAAKVSAHYTVDEDGALYSHVHEAHRAWHAGLSSWKGAGDLNTRSIGIEIVNPGHEYGYRAFPRAQIKAVIKLCREIMARHGIPPQNVLAHSDVAPARKEDPGELFPWKELAEQGVGIWPAQSDPFTVRANALDIEAALVEFGYDQAVPFAQNLLAFQRHYEPEAFQAGAPGDVTPLTRARLYALLNAHWLPAISPL